jgi:cytoskeletal protein RodZ
MTRTRGQDRQPSAVEPGAIPQGSLGAWLRQQREARGVSLRDIADASKISLRYLEALERDRLDVLPAPVFAKGFLREYARVVGLDPDEAVNLYLLALAARDAEQATEPEPAPARERRTAAPSTLGYGLLLTLAVVLFLGVAALLSFYAGRRREARLPAPSPEAMATYAAPSPAEPPESAPSSMLEAPAAGATAVPPLEAVGPLKVTLDFSEDCWVEFVIDGRRRTSELRVSGETLELEAEQSVLLTLGNARGVRVEVDGRPFTLPTNSARVVRDLRIERAPPGARSAAAG